jgi:hypothetical protein
MGIFFQNTKKDFQNEKKMEGSDEMEREMEGIFRAKRKWKGVMK